MCLNYIIKTYKEPTTHIQTGFKYMRRVKLDEDQYGVSFPYFNSVIVNKERQHFVYDGVPFNIWLDAINTYEGTRCFNQYDKHEIIKRKCRMTFKQGVYKTGFHILVHQPTHKLTGIDCIAVRVSYTAKRIVGIEGSYITIVADRMRIDEYVD